MPGVRKIDELLDAVAGVGDPSCDRGGKCSLRKRCAGEQLACSAFVYWVDTGRALDPRMVVPRRVTWRLQPKMGERPLPTRAIYEAMSRDVVAEVEAEA